MGIDIKKFILEVTEKKQFWECPFCKKHIQLVKENLSTIRMDAGNGNITYVLGILCPNPNCKKTSVYLAAYTGLYEGPHFVNPDTEKPPIGRFETLFPHGTYINYPSYIPESIRNDYMEAACIVDLSPKASAALIRRALQGMIKDKKPQLKNLKLEKQIESLRTEVSRQEYAALTAIRKIGNVGAHMEDPGVIAEQDCPINSIDATDLVHLIEYLLKSWYVDIHDADFLMNSISKRGEEIHDIQKGRR
ncbi:hypothetical protein SpiGrapes_2685 [Sphaerochaeta pleomorpha str. Grapes]|uniref:DUF4145 domain-containing protein n=1 Tax=Sphaerochaeta pleomorpha (strain ATCC BAA-1885 / DSM 22778 / Grapes) TaxID=158190 RepID=G8QVC9_SPHPG|nr:DUF4145 domain-containing protein [Sphaerochaeta pleomorpha]AEV30444.1 hypothetical protein SpiGrapes_2685 [Sphaerochaeta pleomorpha str. Grapes]